MDNIRRYVAQIQETLDQLPWEAIRDVVGVLQYARVNDKQVFIMGNGGSAATASHFACDLGKGTLLPDHPRFRVIALTDNMPLFSAYANDYGYEHVFREQLASLVRKGDIAIGISGSGNSDNVLNAIEFARAEQATTIGFAGFDGGKLKEMVDICVHVPNHCMEQVEDLHLILEHLVCTCLRQALDEEPYQLPAFLVQEPWGLRLDQQAAGAPGDGSAAR
jgi:D-sedoheptulose 7-phosphate isomerase